MRSAIMGAGSIGSVIGALVNYNGGQIDLIDTDQANVEALNKRGVTIKNIYNVSVPVTAYQPLEMKGKYDIVLLSIKQTGNGEMLRQLLPHLHENSVVCTLQNGIPEDAIAKVIGYDRTIGGAVGFGATWVEPGVTTLTSTKNVMENYAFEIGEIDGKITPRLVEVQKLLNLVGKCTILDNLLGVRWAKVLMNATFSGMSAALGCTFGEVLNDDKGIRCVANIAAETIKVAHAKGVRLAIMQGEDFEQLELSCQEDIDSKLEFYHTVWDQHVLLKASMLQDLEKGKKTEIDFINGVVCDSGKETNISTPFNDKVVELVKRSEANRLINDRSVLSEFDELLAKAKLIDR